LSAPTARVRAEVYARDGLQCVCCGTDRALEFQHRAAVGMGGSKIRPTAEEGLTACSEHNSRFEHDLQTIALAYGWKVKRWVKAPCLVPVFHQPLHTWFRLTGTERIQVSAVAALDMMHHVYGDEYLDWKAEADRTDRALALTIGVRR
jgi:hypothetical protein